ncbi:fas-associated death domain protein-like [Armigeres subalbatus]|uniref:fas-associated death domain protein-like n=1 Tax=Armigeres subalbatus TaxID=124917 RepID=UPI002ED36A5D
MASSLLLNRPQYEQTCKDYLNLKTIAGNSCACQPEIVKKFKIALMQEIVSVRKLEGAVTLEDLFLLLERRNLLSMLNVQLLIKLDHFIRDLDYSKHLAKYRSSLEGNYNWIKRFYLEDLRYRDRRTLLEKEIEQAKLGNPIVENTTLEPPTANPDPKSVQPPIDNIEPVSGNRFNQNRHTIFTLLSKEIGRNWNTFGRLLQLSDSRLEEIEFRHPRNVKAIVGEILETAEKEQREDGQDMFFRVLLQALVDFRRKDLKNKIEKLLR